MDKADLRRRARRLRARLSADHRAAGSEAITDRLRATTAWRAARSVGLFASIGAEVDTASLLSAARREGKQVALPVVLGKGIPLQFRDVTARASPLARSGWGVPEPDPSCEVVPTEVLDLVVFPGLCFDRAGGRLGYGGGFYDRTFATARAARWMVAFAEQAVPEVPMGPHDLFVHGIVTPLEVVVPAGSRPSGV